MKCIVVSDNHGNTQVLNNLFRHYEKEPVLFFHCGDSEMSPKAGEWNKDCYRVVGNCDGFQAYPHEVVVEVGKHKIFMSHGHIQGVKNRLETLAQAAKQAGAIVAFYGHTHILNAQAVDGVLCINPGSIFLPKGLYGDTPTYATVDIEDEAVRVQYWTADHQAIEALYFEWMLNDL